MGELRAAMPEPGFKVRGEGSYALDVPDQGLSLVADRVRREHHELQAELAVYCYLPGARTVNGSALSIADMNLSSARARQDRAKLLAQRANTSDLDWVGLVEEFCQRIIEAERAGQPAVDLRELPRPAADDALKVKGFSLPRRHPTVLFGDGGAAKSYTALWLAGCMAEQGLSVGFFDWELAGEDHRDRLERLFPDGMPRILYARCERPLVHEVDRLRRLARGLDYAVYDSVAFACDGPPEAAEVAGAYFRAARQIGVGSLHVAHISKAEGGDRKPFGSAFWHNGARSTWFVKAAEESEGAESLTLAFFNRKSNLSKLSRPLGFEVAFAGDVTSFRRSEVADTPEFAARMTVTQRMQHLLNSRPLTVTQIAEELDVGVNTVTQTVNRYVKKGRVFIVLDGQNTNRRIGLLGA
jgi:hypothetical protein